MYEREKYWFLEQNNISEDIPVYTIRDNIYTIISRHGYADFLLECGECPYKKALAIESSCVSGIHVSKPVGFQLESFILVLVDRLKTVFHELVHHRQHVRKDLVINYYGSGYLEKCWRGVPICPRTPYMKLPWEIQAMSEEKLWSRKYEQTKR